MKSDDRPAREIRKVAFASLVGTTIEWYDFVIYSQAAALVMNRLFFPEFDPVVGTLASLATFAVGFVARPVGGIIFGHLGDRVGRKTTLVTTLLIMGLATVFVGLLPTYAQIGIWAPIVLVVLRILQGVAVGGEWGGAVLMSVEHAPSNRRGFYASWAQLGIPLSLILATGTLAGISAAMPEAAFVSWGWRLPFLLSALLVVVGLIIRLRVEESPVFARIRAQGRQVKLPIGEILRTAKKQVLLTTGLCAGINVGFYVITVYAIAYATTTVGLSRNETLFALIVGSIVDFVAILLFALLSDRVGRRPILIFGNIFLAVFAYPYFAMAASGSAALLTLATVLGLALGHAPVYAVTSSFFAESFTARTRYSGISLAYQLAAALISGPTPIVAAALVAGFGGYLPVVTLMVATAVISLLCLVFLAETRHRAIEDGEPEAADQRVGVVEPGAAG
ncbi:MFS transporter [Pseudonocardia acaciae]|uniref:MFS transporter n=1 Tax=Pseudonocardia acaciae TaxID=551276 RepID=UPI000685CBB2|nr:MFS transporter [Pseudonocardia acaciae]